MNGRKRRTHGRVNVAIEQTEEDHSCHDTDRATHAPPRWLSSLPSPAAFHFRPLPRAAQQRDGDRNREASKGPVPLITEINTPSGLEENRAKVYLLQRATALTTPAS
ncbi:MAG: hypothetical protein ACR2HX_03060 [Pyrinomonadaceae bacterium]